jgi:dienelactone hydrolase
MGASAAELLAVTRPGARGAVLMAGAVPLAMVGAERWPPGVALQLHRAERDPWIDPAHPAEVEAAARAAGAPVEHFVYPGDAHLFGDAGLAKEYDAALAEQQLARVTAFLAGL